MLTLCLVITVDSVQHCDGDKLRPLWLPVAAIGAASSDSGAGERAGNLRSRHARPSLAEV